MTGGYDCQVALWDERMLKGPEEELQVGKSVWDIKSSPHTNKWVIASVYDGYQIDVGDNKDQQDSVVPCLNTFNLANYAEHESICYASEFTSDPTKLITTSFYDNMVHLVDIR